MITYLDGERPISIDERGLHGVGQSQTRTMRDDPFR